MPVLPLWGRPGRHDVSTGHSAKRASRQADIVRGGGGERQHASTARQLATDVYSFD